MGRLFPVLLIFWAFLWSVTVVGPLGNLVYNNCWKEPEPELVTFLLIHWHWEISALVLVGALTFWSWKSRTDKLSHNSGIDAQNLIAGRDTIIAAGSVQTGVSYVGSVTGDYVAGDKLTYQSLSLPPAALHQLSPPPRDFTGRSAEITELLSKINNDGVTIISLHGMGGIGKTALALKVAEKFLPRYPDAQFYLDLKGTSSQPLSSAEAMIHVVQSYYPGSKLPDTKAGLSSLYQSVLHNRRTLLVMDNAVNGEQVAPLIPPSLCLLLVTSRQHFSLPGAFAKLLAGLPPQDAHTLLLTIAPRIDTSAADMAKLCGYLPLALRVAASTLATRIDLSPSAYLHRLSDARQRLALTEVEAVLNSSFELLSPEVQQLWCVLAVFMDTFDSQAAAAVWDLPLDHTHNTLSLLFTRSLLEWTSETGRYHLHDLVHLFAAAHLEEKTRIPGQYRHSAFYQKLAATADDLYVRGGDAIAQGLALFDMEWDNIRAGQDWAASQRLNDNIAASLCIDYALMAANLLSLRQHPLQSIQWLEAALAAAQQLQHRLAESNAFSRMGSVFLTLGEPRRAIALQEQALAIVRDLGNRRGEAGVLSNLGLVYTALNEPSRAIELHNRQLALAREIGDRQIEAIALGNLGDAYKVLGERNRAIEFYKQALKIHEERGDRHGKAAALVNMGLAYKDLGKTRLAIRCYESGLEIFRELGDRSSEGASLNNLGEAYLKLHKPHRALKYCEQSLEIARVFGDRQAESDTLINLGVVFVKLRDPNRALEFYQQALALNRKIEDRQGEALTLFGMSLAFAKLGQRSQAIAHAESALVIFQSLGDSYTRAVRRQLTLWRLIQRLRFWK